MTMRSTSELAGAYRRRRVLPRWRPSGSIRWHLFSSRSDKAPSQGANDTAEIRRSFALWKSTRSIGYLADAFSSSLELRDSTLRGQLASELLEHATLASSQLLRSAEAALGDGGQTESETILKSFLSSEPSSNIGSAEAVIHNARSALRIAPKDPLLWNDLAFAYNFINEPKKAEKAMLSAVETSQWNPWIIRGATRLLTHLDNDDRAIHLTRSYLRQNLHPLVLSAHISVSQLRGQTSTYLNQARKSFNRLSKPSLLWSELHMALATQMFYSHDVKRLKKFLKTWHGQHTENAFAQGVWMNHSSDQKIFDPSRHDVKNPHEALAWQAYQAGDWAQAEQYAWDWLMDQPFSSRPAILGSFIGVTFTNNLSLAKKFCEIGLQPNPKEWTLRNNLVVAAAKLGDKELSRLHFDMLPKPDSASREFPMWSATQGLVFYGERQILAARQQYDQARRDFRRLKLGFESALATYFQAKEEVKLGNFEGISDSIEESITLIPDKKSYSNQLKSNLLELKRRPPS